MAVPVVLSFRIPGLRRRPDLEESAKSRAKALHEWATGLEDNTRIANQQAVLEGAEAQADPMRANGSIRHPRNQPHHLQSRRHLSRSGHLKKLQLLNAPITFQRQPCSEYSNRFKALEQPRPAITCPASPTPSYRETAASCTASSDRLIVVLDLDCTCEKRPADVRGHEPPLIHSLFARGIRSGYNQHFRNMIHSKYHLHRSTRAPRRHENAYRVTGHKNQIRLDGEG
ncbi:hypothetical protein LZ31DRAFT_595639 [Colletotrichum somersetense]|nr:hypothetical protein LZ31DRAFT_595639 [Colletotrichum somersetense]